MTSRFIERALIELGEGALPSQLQTIGLALVYAIEEQTKTSMELIEKLQKLQAIITERKAD